MILINGRGQGENFTVKPPPLLRILAMPLLEVGGWELWFELPALLLSTPVAYLLIFETTFT